MYTVKAFSKGEIVQTLKVGEYTIGTSYNSRTFVIVDAVTNEPGLAKNNATGKLEIQGFRNKKTAERMAEWMNRQESN